MKKKRSLLRGILEIGAASFLAAKVQKARDRAKEKEDE